jgi:hypothetical protein
MRLLMSLAITGILAPLLSAKAPPAPPEDLLSVELIRKAAGSAEIHGIGIGDPVVHGFNFPDVTDWPKFVELLRKREGPAGRIWELLPKGARDQVADDKVVAEVVAQLGRKDRFVELSPAVRGLRNEVAGEIRKMIERPDFYTEKAFKDVPLDKNLKDMVALGDKRTYIQTLRMNRELMATAFPNVVSPVPANYHTVSVVVKAGKPVVLVLTSDLPCQWQVSVEEGGQVIGLILGGSSPQEVFGVKPPILYRAGRDAHAKVRAGDVIGTSRDRNDKSFIRLEGGVKKITGKSFTDFQACRETPKEGFVVKPSTK